MSCVKMFTVRIIRLLFRIQLDASALVINEEKKNAPSIFDDDDNNFCYQ